jgi:hypothetical protein
VHILGKELLYWVYEMLIMALVLDVTTTWQRRNSIWG